MEFRPEAKGVGRRSPAMESLTLAMGPRILGVSLIQQTGYRPLAIRMFVAGVAQEMGDQGPTAWSPCF